MHKAARQHLIFYSHCFYFVNSLTHVSVLVYSGDKSPRPELQEDQAWLWLQLCCLLLLDRREGGEKQLACRLLLRWSFILYGASRIHLLQKHHKSCLGHYTRASHSATWHSQSEVLEERQIQLPAYLGSEVMLMCKHLHLEFCLARMNQVYFPILLHLR
ncbi:hypothetical protein ZEAMMB73_Zm00001d023724 [Zea mays]|uniref:Uncharacterized protein n=1 Tax=Zea mays TaxID=4577 RepID=A0A1D6IV61_MAIZE|nr:hypothetical protein ZEAMMB73_Zm00001d023724 [Zea mays]